MRNINASRLVESLRIACVPIVEIYHECVDILWGINSTTMTSALLFRASSTRFSTEPGTTFATVAAGFYTFSPALIKTTNKLKER